MNEFKGLSITPSSSQNAIRICVVIVACVFFVFTWLTIEPIVRVYQTVRTSNANPQNELKPLNSPNNLSSHSSPPLPPRHAKLM